MDIRGAAEDVSEVVVKKTILVWRAIWTCGEMSRALSRLSKLFFQSTLRRPRQTVEFVDISKSHSLARDNITELGANRALLAAIARGTSFRSADWHIGR